MNGYSCPSCGSFVIEILQWALYGEKIECPNCKKMLVVCGDESFDFETEEEEEWFWLENA